MFYFILLYRAGLCGYKNTIGPLHFLVVDFAVVCYTSWAFERLMLEAVQLLESVYMKFNTIFRVRITFLMRSIKAGFQTDAEIASSNFVYSLRSRGAKQELGVQIISGHHSRLIVVYGVYSKLRRAKT